MKLTDLRCPTIVFIILEVEMKGYTVRESCGPIESTRDGMVDDALAFALGLAIHQLGFRSSTQRPRGDRPILTRIHTIGQGKGEDSHFHSSAVIEPFPQLGQLKKFHC